MSTEEYLRRARAALEAQGLPKKEVDDRMIWLGRQLLDAGPEQEQDLMAQMGQPESLAENLVSQYHMDLDLKKHRRKPLKIIGVCTLVAVVAIGAMTGFGILGNRAFHEVTISDSATPSVWVEEPDTVDRAVAGITEAVEEAVAVEVIEEGTGEFAATSYMSVPQTDPFSILKIDAALGEVHIMRGDDYGVDLSWSGKGYSLSQHNENGVLTVESSGNPVTNALSKARADITIYLPADTHLEELDIDLDMGSLVMDSLEILSADITLNLGSVNGYNLSVDGDLDIQADLGEIYLDGGVFTGDTSVHASMGDVTLNGIYSGPLDVTANMGTVSMTGSFENGADVTANMGSVEITLDDSLDNYGLNLDCSLGTVEVNGQSGGSHASSSRGSRLLNVQADMGSIYIWG